MKRTIELKHVGPKALVRNLLEDLIGRLEEKLGHFPEDAVSLHVLFEENGTHQLYRTSLTCHVPGHTVAAHEERRDAGTAIREAFAEVERQLEKQKAFIRGEHLRKRSRRTTQGLANERGLMADDAAGVASDALETQERSRPPAVPEETD